MSENNYELAKTRSNTNDNQNEQHPSPHEPSIISRVLWGGISTAVLLGPLLIPGIDTKLLLLIIVGGGSGVFIGLILLGVLQSILYRPGRRRKIR